MQPEAEDFHNPDQPNESTETQQGHTLGLDFRDLFRV